MRKIRVVEGSDWWILAVPSGVSLFAMEDFAFLQIEPVRYLIGFGPFTSSSAPPEENGDAAFYVNDFRLSDLNPWKQPAEFRIVENLREFVAGNGSAPLPALVNCAASWAADLVA